MIKTVTADGWFVSRTITYEPGAPKGGTLSVHKGRWNGAKTRLGDWDGKTFQSDDEYERFCLEHGYLQRYYRVEHAIFRRVFRRKLEVFGAVWHHRIMHAESRKRVIEIADRAKAMVNKWSGNPLLACTWANGVYMMARRLRPELFEENGRGC